MEVRSTYRELGPSQEIKEYIDSFWTHQNLSDEPEQITIFPDSFFKLVFIVSKGEILKYFITGLWTEPKEITIPARSASFGCRLKILAPEYLLKTEVASIINGVRPLSLSYLNINKLDITDFSRLVSQWEAEFLKSKTAKSATANKLRLSRLLYEKKGSISAMEVASQIYWSNRQINRYLNKYLGIPLKKYLNIQKCYEAYIQIREGNFFPRKDYFDQAHFIREVKKYTGETPRSLFQHQNDRFIQLKNIKRE